MVVNDDEKLEDVKDDSFISNGFFAISSSVRF